MPYKNVADRRASQARWQKTHRPYYAQKLTEYREEIKRLVLAHYGKNGAASCVHCGIDDVDVLCLDHILDNGKQEREQNKCRGTVFYARLRSGGFPPGYQTLCANCNLKKEIMRRRAARASGRSKRHLEVHPEKLSA